MVIHISTVDKREKICWNISVNKNLPHALGGRFFLSGNLFAPSNEPLMANRHRLLYAAVGPILFFFFGGIPAAYAESPVSLIISEVNWAGSSKSQADEWIEFKNTGTDPLPLDGFTVQGALTAGAVYSFPSFTLAPGATFLLANYAMGPSSVLTRSPDAVTTAVSLSNSALNLSLYAADGTLLDTASNKGESEPIVVPDVPVVEETPAIIAEPADEPSVIIEETIDEPLEPDPIIELAVEIPIEVIPASTPIGSLLINEIFSSPHTGEDEWVEIHNPFNNVIPLNGWTIRDGSGKSTPLPDQLLGFDQFLIIKNPAGKLNNDGDSVILADATGRAIDAMAYGGSSGIPAPAKSHALARTSDGTWQTTLVPTPGAGNVIIKPVSSAKSTLPATTTTVFEMDSGTPDLAAAAPQPSAGKSKAVPTPTPDFDLTASFILSELYPNTNGNDLTEEYVEVRNAGDRTADLRGWIVRDRSGITYVYGQKTLLEPGEALALPRSLTRISLNNEGDTITLLRPDKTTAAEIAYGKAPRGESYGLFDGAWNWTNHPTPDEANVPASAVEASAPVKKAAAPKAPKKPAPAPVPLHVSGIITSRSGRTVQAEKDGSLFSITLPVGTNYAALGIHSGRLINATGTAMVKNGKVSLSVKSIEDVRLSDFPVPTAAPIQDAQIQSDESNWLSQFMSSASLSLRRLFGRA